jgi:hypothetical protein
MRRRSVLHPLCLAATPLSGAVLSCLLHLQEAVVAGSRLGAYGDAEGAMPGELQTQPVCLLLVHVLLVHADPGDFGQT